MKKILCFCLSFAVLVSLCACGAPDAEGTVPTTVPTETESAPVPSAGETEEVLSYSELRFTEFLFSSGAGAWGTLLYINEDGSFSGNYHDSEMGDNAEEYPMGTVYHCGFSGQFGTPVRLDDHSWSLPIRVLQYDRVPDSQEIRDGIRWFYTTAFGLEQTTSITLFEPGTPLELLPVEYRQWVGLHTEEGELPFWGLYNEPQQQGFSGTDLLSYLWEALAAAEAEEAAVEQRMQTLVEQSDLNFAAQQRYNCWDNLLNQTWGVLKRALPEEKMDQLTALQLEWIESRDLAAEEAAGAYEGGSLESMVFSTTAADWTKERVYYLMQYLPAE